MSVALRVDGKDYSGWLSASVIKSLESIYSVFSLQVTNKYANLDDFIDIQEGDACELFIDGEKLITGTVEKISVSLTSDAHTLTIEGRDKTGLLEKCSAVHTPGQWNGQTVAALASLLCKPFGVSVSVEANANSVFPKFAINPGETVLEALRRLMQNRGLLLAPDGNGGLIISQQRFSNATVALVQGENILEASADYDESVRYSPIIVKGQSPGTANSNGRITNGAQATVLDPSVEGYQPLLVVMNGQATSENCRERALWELASRNGKALKASVTVVGWRQKPKASLWKTGQLVQVQAPACFLDEALVVNQVTYMQEADDGGRGQVCELELLRPDAYKPEPLDPEEAAQRKAKRKKGKKQKRKKANASALDALNPIPQYEASP